MSVTDTSVQVAPDSTGAKIDNSSVTRADASVVLRQRLNISDPADPNAHAAVNGEEGRGAVQVGSRELLEEIHALHETVRALAELVTEFLHH